MKEYQGNNNAENQADKLEKFFELSPALICIAGYDGYFKRINPSVSRTLGYSTEELFSRPINDFVHPDDRDLTTSKRESLYNNAPLLNFENRYLTKNNETVWLSWTSMPIESDKVVFAVAKDITFQKKIEEQRNEQIATLTHVNNELKQLTYTTSHDLRAPVNNLLSVFSYLDTSKIEDEQTLEIIQMLRDATANLKSTLDNYLDTFTLKKEFGIKVESLNLYDAVERVLISLQSLIDTMRVKIQLDFSAFQNIDFNRTYLESILLNLITNSIKYAKPNAAPVIKISTRLNGERKQLIFRDEGIGFDMDNVKDKVFGLNQRFSEHSDSKGIGLYLIYNHVTALGGQISLDSKINEGACFAITFKA
nr:PAS domain-containing sensor histidine kinase [Mucilaginibacter straminoryzae]